MKHKKIKTCPTCREKMTAMFNSEGKIAYWECANSGNLLSGKKGIFFIETTQNARP